MSNPAANRLVRVLLVNRFNGGAHVPTGRMLRDVARQLEAMGHQVTVLASSGHYDGAATGVQPSAGQSGGASRIIRLAVPGWVPRAGAWVWFTWQARRLVPGLEWDACVLLTDPPLLPWLVGRIKRLCPDRKLAAWLMDLYPEALAAAGRLNPAGVFYRHLHQRRQNSLRQADLLICLGDAQRERLGPELVKNVRTRIVPPWDARQDLLESQDADLRDIALYAGNLGEAHCFEPILAAARHLPSSWTLRFAVRGAKAAALRRAVSKGVRSGARVEVTGYVGEAETSQLLSSARVHLITMSQGWDGIVVPSKLYGCVRTGRPVLFLGPATSDTAREIVGNGWGTCLPAGADGIAVAEAILQLAARPTAVHALPDGAKDVANLIAGMAS